MKTRWIAIFVLALIPAASVWAQLTLPTDPAEQEQLFQQVDTNNDNCLSYVEVSSAYPFLVSRTQYNSYDVNGDGCVDRAELGIASGDGGGGGGNGGGGNTSGGCGCNGCNGAKSSGGDLLTVLISLLGLAVLARPAVG